MEIIATLVCINNLNYTTMLRWAAIFLVIAIVAAIFGFGGIAESSAEIAKIIFYIFIVLLLLSLIFGAKVFNKK